MESIIKEARGDDGDNVLYTVTRAGSAKIYEVHLYNNRTAHTLRSFCKVVPPGAPRGYQKDVEEDAEGAFEEACDFMGLGETEE